MNIYKQNGERLVQLCMERKATFRYDHKILEDVFQLLKAGANPNYFYPDDIQDVFQESGTTPLSASMYTCFIECMILLKHFGAEFGKIEWELLDKISEAYFLYKAFPELVSKRPSGRLSTDYAMNPDANMHTPWKEVVANILNKAYSDEIKTILKRYFDKL